MLSELQHGNLLLSSPDSGSPTAPAGQLFHVELGEPEEDLHHPASSSEESDDDAPVPATTSGSDVAADAKEVQLSVPVTYPTLPFFTYVKPNARGAGAPTYDFLNKLTAEEGRHRLIFTDFVHPYNAKSPGLLGGYKLFLLCMDYKTRYVLMQPLKKRDEAMNAFGAIAISQGYHKLPHVVHVVSDGEPVLVQQIRQSCQRLGLSCGTSVPGRPNTNPGGSTIVKELRKMANCALLDATRHGNVITGKFEAIAWEYAVHTHNRLANNTDVTNRTPYEMNYGVKPVFRQVPFGSPCYMYLSPEARRAHVARHGQAGAYKAEPALYIGERDGHHRGLTRRGTGRCGPMLLDVNGVVGVFPGDLPALQSPSTVPIVAPNTDLADSAAPIGQTLQQATGSFLTSADSKLRIVAGKKTSKKAYIQHRCNALAGKTVAEALQLAFPNASGTSTRYRRVDMDYDLRCKHLQIEVVATGQPDDVSVVEAECLHNAAMMLLAESEPTYVYEMEAAQKEAHLAEMSDVRAQRNLSFKQFLAPHHPQRQQVIDSYEKEIKTIIAMGVMEELKPGTQEYAEALTSPATTLCRVLLDRKSDGTIKSRIVVRGDLENIERTDGPGFNYYAVTASLPSIRLALFQSGRHVLQPGQTPADWLVMSSCDVTSAFCQSDKNDDGVKRFLKVHSPINHIWYYYAQYKPLYGSCSAPVRWQNTFASWITTTIEAGGPGFLRAENAGAVYRQPPRSDRGALLLVIYVDDIMLIGTRADQESFYVQLNKRFQCKPVQWLEKNKPLDHLGITFHEDDDYVWMSMEKYIKNMLVILNMQNCQPMSVPFTGPIVDLKELCEDRRQWYVTAQGMTAWLSSTGRPDARFTTSRLAQYNANPCQGAFNALVQLVRYFATTAKLAIRQELNVHSEWRLFSDSDMAGNGESINKRRSQLGSCALLGNAPITWSSKTSSVQFGEARLPAGFPSSITAVTAHRDIAGEHVATSSAEAETYALGVFANEVLHLSYVAEEAGIPFPRPAVIQVDNQAAIAFSKQSQFAGRSKLRHVDCRAEWLKVLRDSNLIHCVHVSSANNLADIFTRPLDTIAFTRLRDQMMAWCPW